MEGASKKVTIPFPSCRPERHYMRGPGPKWLEKNGRVEGWRCGFAVSAFAALGDVFRPQSCYSACNFDPLNWGIGVQF
jgi:hypothetical protein